jgi:hypothetical protein
MRREASHDLGFSEIGLLTRCWVEALTALRRVRPLVCLLPWLVAEALWVGALAWFPHPPFDVWFAPLFEAVGGSEGLHYPATFAELPLVERLGGLGVSFVIGSWCVAALALRLPNVFGGRRASAGDALRGAYARLPAVWLVTRPRVLFVVLAIALALRAGAATDGFESFVPVGGFAGAILVDLAFAYAAIAVVVGRVSAKEAILRSVGLVGRFPWSTAALVLVPRLLGLPFLLVELDMSEYFGIVPPEASLAIVAVRVLVSFVAVYFEVAACTRLYLHAFGSSGGAAR